METSYDGDGIDDGGADAGIDDSMLDDGGDSEGGDEGTGAANDIAYLGELPEGMTDDDLSIVQNFFGGLNGRLPPEIGQELLSKYVDLAAQWDAEDAEADEADEKAAMGKLHGQWGAHFHANLNQLHRTIDATPFADDLNGARLPDGRLLLNHPEIAQWIYSLLKGEVKMTQQRTRNAPANRQALQREKEQIQEVMRSDRPKYNRDQRMQRRYLDLIGLLGDGD